MTDRGETYRSVWRDLMKRSFRQDYADVAGIRTRYIQMGDPEAPPVVMLHGTGGHWETFTSNIGPLSEHFNVYAIDMMGCGFSDSPEGPHEIPRYVAHLIAFMDLMGIQRASVVGQSLGAWTAARAALMHPDRIDRIVLVAPTGLLPLPASSAPQIAQRLKTATDPSWDKISDNLSHLYYDQANLTGDMIAIRQAIYSAPGAEGAMARMMTLMDPDLRTRNNLTEDEWRGMTTPTLMIAHVDSPDTSLEATRKLEKLIPGVQVLEIKRAAHWPQFEDPATFNAGTIRFLKGEKAA